MTEVVAKIRWKEHEMHAFLQRYAELALDQPELSNIERARQAQASLVATCDLEPDRVRNLTHTAVWNYREDIARVVEEVKESRRLAAIAKENEPAPVAAPIPEAPVESSALADAAVNLFRQMIEHPAMKTALLTIMSEISRLPAPTQHPEIIAPSMRPHQPFLRTAAKEPEKSILIVGLLPKQQQVIMQEYRGNNTLRFLSSKDSHHRTELQARNVDLAIGMIGFIHHQHEHHIRKGVESGKKRYLRCNGTVTDLKRLINSSFPASFDIK